MLHYFVWCLSVEVDPIETDSMRAYMDSRRHIPGDIDVLDPKEKLIEDIPSHDNVVVKEVSEDIKTSPSMFHKKYSVKWQGMFPVEIFVDIVKRDTLDISLLDFDINGLQYNKQTGLTYSGVHACNCKSILCKMKDAESLHKGISGIIEKRATFMQDLLGGEHRASARKRYLTRIRKMIERGFTVTGWDEEYPSYIVEMRHEKCQICYDEVPPGYRMHSLRCGKTIGSSGVCKNCFWELLMSCANKGKYFECPLCREQRILFGTQEALALQKNAIHAEKVARLVGIDAKADLSNLTWTNSRCVLQTEEPTDDESEIDDD